ncbi:MAG: acyl--CoA ligase, partial [Armatimonadota bacterium]|nr:acyl--CoA ligase [Armatimonadota bacterium]
MMDSPQNLVQLLEHSAESYGDRPFATADDGSAALSFRGLAEAAADVARGLWNECGVRPGDHVALLLPNCVSFLPAYFGILRAGAVAVPINARLKPAEFEFILGDCDAQVLFVHPRTWPAVKTALESLPDWKGRLVGVDFPPGADVPDGMLSLSALCMVGGDTPAPSVAFCDDVAAIIYTSGTTGRPKGAMLTHGNVLFNIEATKAGHGLVGSDIHLLVVPLFHVTGLNTIMPTALEGGAQLVVSAQVDPAQLISVIRKHGCTTFFGVPTTFYLLTNLKDVRREDLRTLRLIAYSGAPMAPLTIGKLREMFRGVELHNFFGLTETTSVSTVLPDDQAIERCESVGLPPPGVELAIWGESGDFLPAGEVGELVIRGLSVFKGYYKRPEATTEALKDGWFHTGDTATLDEEGYLFLRGRKKELIIVAGENVYPIEVENALCSHPAVQEAAVFGKPDRFLGESVQA